MSTCRPSWKRLDSGVSGRIVDVTADEDGKRVEIFIE